MELTIKLDDSTDVSFFKKMLLQLKCVKSVEILEDEKNAREEIESSPEFKNIIEKSTEQIKNGQFVEHSKELMDSIFRNK
jgi:hypothetical protein